MRKLSFSFLICFAKLLAAANIESHRNWHLLDHEECGESISDRIIGGSQASLGQFPWMAQLGYKSLVNTMAPAIFKCGGSLINQLYVLTAAHCLTDLSREKLDVIRLGEHDARTEVDCDGDNVCAPRVQDFAPARIIIHTKYQQPKMRNDIALIRLNQKAALSRYVNPICVPYGSLLTTDFVDTRAEVAGWGVSKMQRRPQTSPVLLHVRVPLVDPAKCNQVLGRFAATGVGQLCAGGQTGHDSCGGDSGGPLMKVAAVDGPPKYYLIGIVSFGTAKCGSDIPAVYTDVTKYVHWILDHVQH